MKFYVDEGREVAMAFYDKEDKMRYNQFMDYAEKRQISGR